jgi:hypothetical protein
MNSDHANLTMRSVELLVAGWINVTDPPGSYGIEPDAPLGLLDVLKAALDECGLGDRLEDVYWACHTAAAPRFAKRIAELEAIRQRVLADADAASLDQVAKILDPTGGLNNGPPNLTPVAGTQAEQHRPYESRKRPPRKG